MNLELESKLQIKCQIKNSFKLKSILFKVEGYAMVERTEKVASLIPYSII